MCTSCSSINKKKYIRYHCSHDGGEVVVGQHHVRSALGHLRARDAHGDALVRKLNNTHTIVCAQEHVSTNAVSIYIPYQ